MTVGRRLTEIRHVMEDELDAAAEHEEKRTAGNRWNVIEKTLRTVQRTADRDAMDELAAWVEAEIRERGAVPSGREVRERGRAVCEAAGFEVAPGSWLRP